MNRRGFLAFVGAFAAGAALPKALLAEKIAKAPKWATDVSLYRVSVPLEAGTYTLTGSAWQASTGEYLGCYFGCVTADGGETLFEVPGQVRMEKPTLHKGGITYSTNGWWSADGVMHVTGEQLVEQAPPGIVGVKV